MLNPNLAKMRNVMPQFSRNETETIKMSECPKCRSRNVKRASVFEYHNFNECLNCKSIFTSKFEDCCKNPNTILVIEYYGNNDKRLFDQCTNCGGAFRKDKFPLKTHSKFIKSEFSETNFDNWNKKRNDENSVDKIEPI